MKVKLKLIKYNWLSFVNFVMRFSLKDGQLIRHRITVLCTEGVKLVAAVQRPRYHKESPIVKVHRHMGHIVVDQVTA